MSKIVARIIVVLFTQHIYELGILLDEQFGFHYTTEQQILRLMEYATDGLNRKLTTRLT